MPSLKAKVAKALAPGTQATGERKKIQCPRCDWHADRYIAALGDSTTERADLYCQCHRKQQSSAAASAPPPSGSQFVINPAKAAKRKAAGGG